MKNLTKKLGLTLVIILLLGISFGCSQDNKSSQPNKDIHTNVGFVDDIITENNQEYVIIGVEGDTLRLQMEKDFETIEKGEFYKFAYNENNLLLSIEKDAYIKGLVKDSMGQGQELEEEIDYIQPVDKISTDNLTLLDFYDFDINEDGDEERISMYVNAEKGSNDEILWDDGQDWLFVVEGMEEDYILFNDYVQLGTIQFYVYTENEDFFISTVQSGTANLKVTEYKFDKETKEFISSVKHKAIDNVNMLHSSSGY